MAFNDPDPAPFREALRKAGFYAEWKKKYGDEAWAILEEVRGSSPELIECSNRLGDRRITRPTEHRTQSGPFGSDVPETRPDAALEIMVDRLKGKRPSCSGPDPRDRAGATARPAPWPMRGRARRSPASTSSRSGQENGGHHRA